MLFFLWVDVFNLRMGLMAFEIPTDDGHTPFEHSTSIAAIAFIFPYWTIFGRWTLGIDSNTENGVIAGEKEANVSDLVNAW